MQELTLELDNKVSQEIDELMNYYNRSNRAEVISQALAVLKIAHYVDKTNGELIARRGDHETKIVVR